MEVGFNYRNRESFIEKLSREQFDLVVIGGGVTGVGIALDAQSRGLKTALIEMQDFAQGTSSRSTKLIHGGLRYLKQYEFSLVAEVGKERAIVHKNAPHLTVPEKMLLPIVENGSIGKLGANFGLWLYDFLAGVKKKEKRKMLSSVDTMTIEPLLDRNKVKGGALYYEYRTDDARLTFEIIREAVNQGAVAMNYAKAEGFLMNDDKRITGVKVRDLISDKTFQINASYFINATGPWVDLTDELDASSKSSKLIHTKGIHIVVDQKRLPVKQSVYFDVSDKRMVFAIPRENKTYIGTTDTFYTGDLRNPHLSLDDRQYLVNAANEIFPSANLKLDDIESGWAGLRPLIKEEGKSPSAISRKDEVFEYKSGLITIAGGKLTGYRKMAEKVVDIIRGRLKKDTQRDIGGCKTDNITLAGGKFGGKMDHLLRQSILDGKRIGLSESEVEKIFYRFGSNTGKLFLYADKGEIEGLPLFWKLQLLYCLDEEMVINAEDFLVRRTGALYFDIDGVRKYKDVVVKYMTKYFNWSELIKEQNVKGIDDQIFISTDGK